MNTLISFLLLLVVVLVTTVVQVQCNETCTEQYTIIPGPTPRDGRDGVQGVPGRTGDKGNRGDIGPTGPKGDPGSTIITEEDLNRVGDNVTAKINESIIAELLDTIQTLNQTLTDRILYLESQIPVTVCNITSANWRRIAYFDTTQGDSCPTGLYTLTNNMTNQTACGTTSGGPVCISLNFSTGGEYTNICGRVRGYVYYVSVAFYHHGQGYQTMDKYVDGISITKGSPRQHLWTYASGLSERLHSAITACPCARSNYNSSWIPEFVGNNYYCESGFVDNWEPRVVWEDPLWDGQGCFASNNTCCDRYGWFHRQVLPSYDDLEVRWCKYYDSWVSDILTDQLEIWVM